MSEPQIKVEFFISESGASPFKIWLDELSYEFVGRANDRLKRLKYGNFGDCKNLGDGVFELRFHFGSGYRIYFEKENSKIVILLCAGDKNTQGRDIKKAKKYWEEYKNA